MSMIGVIRRIPASELADVIANPAQLMEEGDAEQLSLEKMWHALHFLLTEDAEMGGEPPLAWAILGRDEVGEDMGYGPARVLDPESVASVAAALEALPPDVLRARFEPSEMEAAGIYPSIWDEDADELWEELSTYYEELRDCYRDAAKSGDAMVYMLT
jgi:hypothetical protein